MVNSFQRLYDGLWARREAAQDKQSSSATGSEHRASPSPGPKTADEGNGAKSGKQLGGTALRGTNRGSRWSMAGEVTHLQRRVADLAAEVQVRSAAAAALSSSTFQCPRLLTHIIEVPMMPLLCEAAGALAHVRCCPWDRALGQLLHALEPISYGVLW